MGESTLQDFPQLETERLQLIHISNGHQEDLLKLFGDDRVVRFYNLKPFKTTEDSKRLIQYFESRFLEKKAVRWGIGLKNQKGIIGTIGYNNFSKNHRANIGFDLQPAFWGKGIMKEVLAKVLDFGFHELEINRVEGEVMKGNIQSMKLLERFSFKKEGLLKDWMYWNERHFDMWMYALIKKEYMTNSAV
ncbi:GNAT family N-acetyltransferase [Xanthovirga aplysinae]|uniref:GNAT family N-acetyltransferase n=1 Tax=Xanthovirga aplysinae TaxID=2529853 RepID=UPI0012BCACB8|nr:GNAT family protein [Xanthovirga aplysinae]MTI31764.1 N-acetyltransferase [Xanthovirga aplysinae]